jgi:hypothetical protein
MGFQERRPGDLARQVRAQKLAADPDRARERAPLASVEALISAMFGRDPAAAPSWARTALDIHDLPEWRRA